MREASYREQPDIHFQHELVLVAETRAGRQLGWATFGAVNTFLEDGVSDKLHKPKPMTVLTSAAMARFASPLSAAGRRTVTGTGCWTDWTWS